MLQQWLRKFGIGLRAQEAVWKNARKRPDRGHGPESLEVRTLPSVFYTYEIVAQTGLGGLTGVVPSSTTLNDDGTVAFVGEVSDGQGIFVAEGATATNITPGFVSEIRTFRPGIQINNSGQVSAVDRVTTGIVRTIARMWDSSQTDSHTIIGEGASPRDNILQPDFFTILQSFTSISNDGTLAFAGQEAPLDVLGDPTGEPDFTEIHLSDSFVDRRDIASSFTEATEFEVPGFFRLMAADDNRVVVGLRKSGITSLTLYELSGFDSTVNVATTEGGSWSALGVSAGISDDGKIVTFYGVLTANGASALTSSQPGTPKLNPGPGIFASIQIGDDVNARVMVRVAGQSGNGALDPGETFNDSNHNGILDGGESDQGPFSSFQVDTRVGVTSRGDHLNAVTVAYVGTEIGTDKVGLYTSQLTFIPTNVYMPHAVEDYTVGTPSLVVQQGQSIPDAGIVSDLSVYDPINNNGQLSFAVSTGMGQAVIRATPHRTPVLFVPGIAGNWYNPDTSSYLEWLMNRGVHPDKLTIDPLLHSYDDLIQSLKNAGYKDDGPDQDLFIANYDWRLDVAPNDGNINGVISGVTGSSISDSVFEYGIDYLGHFLQRANDVWMDRFDQPLKSVDVITHSTGGLVTRAYIQSAAYGDGLPKIDNFIMGAVPNLGASKAWNPLHDNWGSDDAYQKMLSKMVAGAYNKVVESGETIAGPTPIRIGDLPLVADPLTGELRPDPIKFIHLYVPTIRTLLATYDFLDPDSGTYVNVNRDEANRNFIALDLNNGLNLSEKGDVRSFAQHVRTASIFGVGAGTFSRTVEMIGLASDTGFEIAPMNGGVQIGSRRNPGIDETWYMDIEVPEGNGDGTVPLDSLNYAIDDRIQIYRLSHGFEEGVLHTEILANTEAQRQILNLLGASVENISSGLANGSVMAGIYGLPAIWNFWVDPVDAILVDAHGNRLGYSAATGPLSEIPGSVYFGDTDGLGWIVGPVDGPIEVQLTGLGQDYYVRFQGYQGTTAVVEEHKGFLAVGETMTFTVQVAPLVNQPPVAHAGGPYHVFPNGTVQLDGSSSTDPDEVASGLTYKWDLDGDYIYGETGAEAQRGNEIGIRPNFLSTGLAVQTSFEVSLEVTDNLGVARYAQATVHIQPTLEFLIDGVPLSSGSNFSLGATHPGGPALSKVITVRNGATTTINLGTITVTGPGYSVSQPASTTLASGQSTTFAVVLSSGTVGVNIAGLLNVPTSQPVGTTSFGLRGTVDNVPQIVGVTRLDNGTGPIRVAIDFSQPLQSGPANTTSNFSISGVNGQIIPITSAVYSQNGSVNRVTLTANVSSAELPTGEYRVRVNGAQVRSVTGSALASNRANLISHQIWESTDVVTIGVNENGELGVVDGPKGTGFSPPNIITQGDFNRDGILDFASSSEFTGEIVIHYGLPGGGYETTAFELDGPVPGLAANPTTIAAADWNLDGTMDLVVYDRNGNLEHGVFNRMHVLLNNGQGIFTTAPDTPITIDPDDGGYNFLSVADYTGDNLPDLVMSGPVINRNPVSGMGEGSLAVYSKDAFFGYSRKQVISTGKRNWYPNSAKSVDLNNDGWLDVISETTGYYLDEPSPIVFMGTPSGLVLGDYLEYGNWGGYITYGDFDNDGKMDLAILHDNYRTLGDGAVITLLKEDGQGHFSPQPNIIFNRRGLSLVKAGDIDLDGNVDLVLRADPFEQTGFLSTSELSFWVIYGNGLGEFDTSGPMIPYQSTNNIAPGNYLLRDITGDGYPELTFGNQSTGQIGMLLNDGAGKLLPSLAGPVASTATAFNSQDYESGIIVADLNRDGIPDQLRILGDTISTPNQAIDVLWGNPDGQFDVVSSISLATIGGKPNEKFFGNIGFLKVGDLNHDGWLDLIVGSEDIGNGPVQVLLGVDGRQFVTNSELFIDAGLKTGIVSGELSDVNLDGHLDMVSMIFNSNERLGFGVLFGNGTGKLTYSPGTFQLMHEAGVQVPLVGDFNQDNKPDIAIGYTDSSAGFTYEILVYFGLGNGRFNLGQTILRHESDHQPQLYLHDINGDGYQDIISPNESAFQIDFYLGSSSGQFTAAPELSFSIPYQVANLVIGDITGDGFDDIAITQGTASILAFVTTVPIFAGDGTGRFDAPQLVETGSLRPRNLALVPTGGAIEAGIFTITQPVLQVPTGVLNVSTTTIQDKPIAIHPQALVAPYTNDPFFVAVKTPPAHGVVSIQNNATPDDSSDDFFRYAPATGYVGNDSFTYQVSDGRGGTATGVITITIQPENQAPVFNLSTPSLTYYNFDSYNPVVIDPGITVTDADSVNFDQGRLTVAITDGLKPQFDVLDFPITGQGPGQFFIEFDGTLKLANQIIGKLTFDVLHVLSVTFNASATAAIVQAVARHITYVFYDVERTAPDQKTITYTFNDGDGGAASAVKTILLPAKGLTQAPVVTTTLTSAVYSAGGPAISIDDGITVTDADSSHFAGGTVTVDFVTPISLDDRLAIPSEGSGPNQINISGTSVRLGTTVIGTHSGAFVDGSPLVVSLNTNATHAAVQALLRQITFQNVSANPGATSREVRFVVQDGSGDVSTPAIRTISVISATENLRPEITTSGGTTDYSPGSSPVTLDDGFFVDDLDSPNFNGGNLTIEFLSGISSADRLAIRNEGTGLGQINLSGSTIRVGSTPVGTYSGGFNNSSTLVITFNENASPVRVELLMRQLTFHVTGTNPTTTPRVIRFVLSDGDGGVSTPVMKTVTITGGGTGAREAPAVQLPGAARTFSKLGPAVAVDSQAVVLAPDMGSGTIGGGVLTISINDVNTGKKKFDNFNLASLNSIGTSRGTQLVNGRHVTVFDLDPGLTASILQNALRGITFQTSKKGMKFATRSVQIQLADSQGDASAMVNKTINISKKRVRTV